MMNIEYKLSSSEVAITIYCVVTMDRDYLAVAELSEYSISDIDALILNPTGKWFFFNRLNVPKKIRGKGISKKLLEHLSKILDERKINVINTINPSGPLDLQALIKLYSQFGFELIDEYGLMVRYHQ